MQDQALHSGERLGTSRALTQDAVGVLDAGGDLSYGPSVAGAKVDDAVACSERRDNG